MDARGNEKTFWVSAGGAVQRKSAKFCFATAKYKQNPLGLSFSMARRALAGNLVGCFTGGPSDLSSNPRHLDGFGKP